MADHEPIVVELVTFLLSMLAIALVTGCIDTAATRDLTIAAGLFTAAFRDQVPFSYGLPVTPFQWRFVMVPLGYAYTAAMAYGVVSLIA